MAFRPAANILMRGLALALVPLAAAMPARADSAAPAADQRHFTIDEYRVEGNTVLPDDAIEDAVYPFLGPDRTADDVEKARAALDALYAAKGFPTASAEIPEQDVADGVVVLKVVERRVGRLRVRGSRYFSLRDIKDAAPALAEGRVPDMNQVQREIYALNQWPDRTVTPVLRPGAAPGTVDVDLNVKDTLPLHASVELNNRQSADTTPLRTNASVSYNNLWQRGDSATVSYQVAPENPADTQVISTSYLFRIPDSNLALLANYVHSDSHVVTGGGMNSLERGNVVGWRLQIPLGSDAEFSHSFSLGFDYKNYHDTDILGAHSYTDFAYLPLVGQYQAGWSGNGAETTVTATLNQSVRGIGSDPTAFDAKRYDARTNFTYLRIEATRTQDLPYEMQANVHVTGQMTGDSLPSNEEQGAGGLDTVRGYLEVEEIGDYGLAVQTELRSPPLSNVGRGTVDEVRAFVFADGASVAIRNPLPDQRVSYTLASAGAGLRAGLLDALHADLVAATALDDATITRAGTTRVLFRVNGAF